MSGAQLGELGLRLREPAEAPEGALILNHGRGTDENDLYPLLDELDPEQRLLGVSTGAPLTGIPPGGRHWYVVERVGYPEPETFAAGYAALTAGLDGLLAKRGIGWDRVAIGGFSQGAVMSHATALGAGRPIPAALFALSGFIPEVEGWEPDLASRSELPVFVHHGAADPIIPAEFGREARRRLEAAGISVEYLETPVAHSLPLEAVEALREFLARSLDANGAGAAR